MSRRKKNGQTKLASIILFLNFFFSFFNKIWLFGWANDLNIFMQMLTDQPWKWVNLRLSFQPVQFRNIFEVNDRMVKIIGRSKSNWSMVKLTSIVCVFFTQNLPIQTVDIHKIYWLVKICFRFSKSWNKFLNVAKPSEWIGKHQFYLSFNRFYRIYPI